MATLTWLLDVNAPNAAKTFDQISARMKELDASLKKTREIAVGDRNAMATFAKLQLQADRFGERIHNMPLTLEGAARAEAQLLGLEAAADRLDEKLGNIKVDVHRGFLSRLRGLFPGGGGGAGGILQGLGGAATGTVGVAGGLFGTLGSVGGQAGPVLQGGAIGAAIAAAIGLTPALLPLGLGALVGGGGALAGLKLGATARAQLQAMQKSLRGLTGTTPSSVAARGRLRERIAAFQQSHATLLQLGTVGSALQHTLTGTFLGALTAPGPGFSAGPHGQPGGPSFLAGLAGILKQLDGFIKSIGPGLGALFRASLPYLGMFVKFLEQAAKTLLPVFTQMLKQMTPYLPLIGTGLMHIVQGFAGFLKAIGPQAMQASAKIFVALTIAMEYALKGLGIAVNWVAKNIPVWVHDIAKWWDWMRHHTATVFDGIRHDIAHYWDMIFQNSVGTVIRFGHDVLRDFNDFRHRTAVIFDGARHDIAHIWDMIWNNTVGRVQRGVSDVVGWFKGLPGKIFAQLKNLGSGLMSLGKTALNDLWSGLKSVGGSILGWLKNFIGGIPSFLMKLLHMSPPHAGSAFYDLGVNFMHHLEAGIKSRAHAVVNTLHGAVGGPTGGSAAAAAAYARSLLGRYGWGSQWAALNAVAMAESGWNIRARNPSSGAYGIAQFINGPAEYYTYGGNPNTIGGQVTAFLNYVRQRYGSPSAAWAHEARYHWYGSGLLGGVFNRPTLIGVGERGPERVDVTPLNHPGRRPGPLVHIENQYNATPTDAALVAQKLSFAIVAAGLG